MDGVILLFDRIHYNVNGWNWFQHYAYSQPAPREGFQHTGRDREGGREVKSGPETHLGSLSAAVCK